jgi:hypothetical protein
MKNKDLIKSFDALGFPLFEVEKHMDANRALADIVKSKDMRFWEGFPVVLANSAERGLFTYDGAFILLKSYSEKSAFDSLIAMSLAIYDFFSLKFSWSKTLHKGLPVAKQKESTEFMKQLKEKDNLDVSGKKMSSQRLKKIFENYFSQSRSRLNELLSTKDELRLEYALSQVFSIKQKELFLKKLKREKLSKTEREYYSRAVKKKVLALANPELHNLAQRLLNE